MRAYRLNLRAFISVICINNNHYNMKHSPKLAILQSLDAMDHVQMEKVLLYIKHVLVRDEQVDHNTLKHRAMNEIRQALQLERRQALQA
jgi:hypothetical protein